MQVSEVDVPLFTAILACLTATALPSIDWPGIMQRQDLPAFLASHALPGHTELSVLQAVVRLVGVMCRPDTADAIARSALVSPLAPLQLRSFCCLSRKTNGYLRKQAWTRLLVS